jgi:hypothetical protein
MSKRRPTDDAPELVEAGALDEPLLPKPPTLPAQPPPPAVVRGRVWKHGALHLDGKVYAAGAELELPPAVAAQLGAVFVTE